jgi:peroxiredoxin
MSSPKVKVGDRIPDNVYFGVLNTTEEQPHKISASEVFKGKKVVLFGIPGMYQSKTSFRDFFN